ncbi:hypothetical protein NPIL_48331 [Nephila pilipes]|uniref:Uncharacterized protein n=1 Tax=Nephila pilipes TaxID=299642 RepID=A0A8X6TWT9_NEPPI|nr:hypothetical protein NPIL_48331 [Nephila pilipes]
MHLYFFISICLSIGFVYASPCPDGTQCDDGVCCLRYIFGRTYECCNSELTCVRRFTVGRCHPKTSAQSMPCFRKFHNSL